MIGQRELIALGLSLALMGGAFAYGYHKGTVSQIQKFEADRQELQDEILDLNEDLSVKNAENLQLLKDKEELAYELENEALNAAGSSNPGVGSTGGLQRLESRWGR